MCDLILLGISPFPIKVKETLTTITTSDAKFYLVEVVKIYIFQSSIEYIQGRVVSFSERDNRFVLFDPVLVHLASIYLL